MKDAERLAAGFKALADTLRVTILEFLKTPVPLSCITEDGICACDIESYLRSSGHPITQPQVSYHMKVLAQAGLVVARNRGRWVYYEVNEDAVRALNRYLAGFERE